MPTQYITAWEVKDHEVENIKNNPKSFMLKPCLAGYDCTS